MTSEGASNESASKTSTFHTPTTGSATSWLAVKESYDLRNEDDQHFIDPLGIKEETQFPAATPAPYLTKTPASESQTNLRNLRKLPRKQSSASTTTVDDVSSLDSDGLVKLPSSLATAVDQFVQSLKEPKFESPLEPSAVSALYQEFYIYFTAKADHFLQTGAHLPLKKREIQMETYEEIAEKRKERSLRPVRLKEYEESAEARACTPVYERIFRPGIGDDVTRSKDIQARSEVMKKILTLKHLDFDLTGSILDGQSEKEQEDGVREQLKPACDVLELIDAEDAQIPASKLDSLSCAHKMVVQALKELFPDTKTKASADMILPALIYTVLNCASPPELWLNLVYIARYRNVAFLTGEPSYIITNFQAAIGFLESATIESLGLDTEAIDSEIDLTVLTTTASDSRQPILEMTLLQPSTPTPAQQKSYKGLSHRGSFPSLNSKDSGRRSSLMLAPNGIVTSADQAFKNIGQSFNNSYRFLLNKANSDKGTQEGLGQPLLADSYAAIKLRRSLMNESAGSHSAIPSTPPTTSAPEFEAAAEEPANVPTTTEPPASPSASTTTSITAAPAPPASGPSSHLFGRFANVPMFKSFTSTSPTPSSSSTATPTAVAASASRSTSPSARAPAPAPPAFSPLLTRDFESLSISELKSLHEDYIKLVQYLKDTGHA